MGQKTKKVLLFIVDGPTDEDALSPILKRIFQREEICFHVVHGDLTSDWLVNDNAMKTVHAHIKKEMERYGYQDKDMLKVIHLIDTDGCFIPKEHVVKGEESSLYYKDNQIITKNSDKIVERNEKKTKALRRLYCANTIGEIPYSVYYFSRNQEHILHNLSKELSNEEKVEYADEFADNYEENPKKFIEFLTESNFTVEGNYGESWNFIFQGDHSLQRFCNLHLLFQDINL